MLGLLKTALNGGDSSSAAPRSGRGGTGVGGGVEVGDGEQPPRTRGARMEDGHQDAPVSRPLEAVQVRPRRPPAQEWPAPSRRRRGHHPGGERRDTRASRPIPRERGRPRPRRPSTPRPAAPRRGGWAPPAPGCRRPPGSVRSGRGNRAAVRHPRPLHPPRRHAPAPCSRRRTGGGLRPATGPSSRPTACPRWDWDRPRAASAGRRGCAWRSRLRRRGPRGSRSARPRARCPTHSSRGSPRRP